jgi:hypothetical protein
MATLQINARIQNVIDHPFFDYLTEQEKKAIRYDIENQFSFIVYFYEASNLPPVLAMVITNYDHCIHVHEMGGRISEFYRLAETFVIGYAKFKGKSKISFCTKRKAIRNFAEKQGFIRVDDVEFEKAI